MENSIYVRQLALIQRKSGRDRPPRPGVRTQGNPWERGFSGAGPFGKDLEKEREFPGSWPS